MLRGWAAAALENVALWHERDISHSSVERVAIPDACLALDFALARLERVLDGLVVDVDRMRLNLEMSRGAVFSHVVLLALISNGMKRHAAYRVVQQASAEALDSGTHLRDALARSADCTLDDRMLSSAFDLERLLGAAGEGVDHLRNVTPEWMRNRSDV